MLKVHVKFNCIIVADGAAKPNPGIGVGWAAGTILADSLDGHLEYSSTVSGYGFSNTSNYAETTAILEGLRLCPDGSTPLIITDSMVAVKVLTRHRNAEYQSQNPDLDSLKTLAYDIVYWKGLHLYRDNIIRINGNHHAGGSEFPLHSVMDGKASALAKYAYNLLM